MYFKHKFFTYFALTIGLTIFIQVEGNSYLRKRDDQDNDQFQHRRRRSVSIDGENEDKNLTRIHKKMLDIGIVPHIIPQLPTTMLHVTYSLILSWYKYFVQEGDGETFHEFITKNRPKIEWECSPLLYYTFFMTHINVTNNTVPFTGVEYFSPNPDRFIGARQYHNWLYYNIPGCDFYHGEELFHYIAPKKMPQFEHRTYLFLMFKQKRKFSITLEERKRFYFLPDWKFHNSHRWEFPIQEFMEKYDLGELIAGNFFRQQGDNFPKIF